MTVKDVMTRDVETIRPEASVHEAAELMRTLDVGPLPVCDGEKLVGMLTDRDIVVRVVALGKNPNATRVSEAMTAGVDWCQSTDEVDEALRHMQAKQIRRLVVVDENRKLCGIVSLGDLSRESSHQHTAEALRDISSPTGPGH